MGYPNVPRGPARPSNGPAVLSLMGGLFGGLIAVSVWMTQAYHGFGSAFFSVFVAGGAWLVIFGIAGRSQKKLPKVAHLGILLGITLLATVSGPSLSSSYYTSSEQTLWKQLSKSTTTSYAWSKYETDVARFSTRRVA